MLRVAKFFSLVVMAIAIAIPCYGEFQVTAPTIPPMVTIQDSNATNITFDIKSSAVLPSTELEVTLEKAQHGVNENINDMILTIQKEPTVESALPKVGLTAAEQSNLTASGSSSALFSGAFEGSKVIIPTDAILQGIISSRGLSTLNVVIKDENNVIIASDTFNIDLVSDASSNNDLPVTQTQSEIKNLQNNPTGSGRSEIDSSLRRTTAEICDEECQISCTSELNNFKESCLESCINSCINKSSTGTAETMPAAPMSCLDGCNNITDTNIQQNCIKDCTTGNLPAPKEPEGPLCYKNCSAACGTSEIKNKACLVACFKECENITCDDIQKECEESSSKRKMIITDADTKKVVAVIETKLPVEDKSYKGQPVTESTLLPKATTGVAQSPLAQTPEGSQMGGGGGCSLTESKGKPSNLIWLLFPITPIIFAARYVYRMAEARIEHKKIKK